MRNDCQQLPLTVDFAIFYMRSRCFHETISVERLNDDVFVIYLASVQYVFAALGEKLYLAQRFPVYIGRRRLKVFQHYFARNDCPVVQR